MVIIDEHGLAAFRREQLSVPALLGQIDRHVRVYLQFALGGGKSYAFDQLMQSPELYGRYDLVILIAPTWDILNERTAVRTPELIPAEVRIVRPRPEGRCGEYAPEWKRMERRGLAALAKDTLCKDCIAFDPGVPCTWPSQLRKMEGVHLVVMTEQQLLLNPSIILMLKVRTRATRVLVLLDEARFVDASFVVKIELESLRQAEAVLYEYFNKAPNLVAPWLESVRELMQCKPSTIRKLQLSFPQSLLYSTTALQRIGVNLFGEAFVFIGYALAQLAHSRAWERHRRMDGTVVFTDRPYLQTRLVITSAHLDPRYIAHRLGTDSIPSPFADVRVHHTQTRIVNLRSRMGAMSYFSRNRKQVLDTFAVLIRRNIQLGRSTLLVCRKRSRKGCAEYLRTRLLGWGHDVQFLVGASDLPATPVPTVIPIINYGVLGTNDFTLYESALCLTGYYIAQPTLNRALAEFEPDDFGHEIQIVTHGSMIRRAELIDREASDHDRTWLANLYLRRLEVDPVLQAAGRVRFVTMPREVVLFQMADFRRELGEIEIVDNLVQLRRAFDLPSAKEIDHEVVLRRIEEGVTEGLTVEAAAARADVSRRTAFRLRAEAKSARNPIRIHIRGSGTPEGSGGAA